MIGRQTKAQLLDRIEELETNLRHAESFAKKAESHQARAEAERDAYKLRLESVTAVQEELGLTIYRATGAPERPVCVYGATDDDDEGFGLSVFERDGHIVGVRVFGPEGDAVAGAGLVSFDHDAEVGAVEDSRILTSLISRAVESTTQNVLDSLGSDEMAEAYNESDD